MYSAKIKLPAKLKEADISEISKALAEDAGAFCALREENNDASPWVLEWYLEDRPDKKDMTQKLGTLAPVQNISVNDDNWIIEEVPEIDWLEHSYKQFPPFSIGSFYIYGSHCEDNVPAGQTGLQIDATTAFGSGEHETTSGCLEALLHLKEQGLEPENILDMGTGTAILAIAAWRLWEKPVLAVDNDPESIRVSNRHCDANNVAVTPQTVDCHVSEGFSGKVVREKSPYDLIIANILAGTLIEMSDEFTKAMAPGGYCVLSGILNEQGDSVLSVYESYDLELKDTFRIGEWSTLVMQKPA